MAFLVGKACRGGATLRADAQARSSHDLLWEGSFMIHDSPSYHGPRPYIRRYLISPRRMLNVG